MGTAIDISVFFGLFVVLAGAVFAAVGNKDKTAAPGLLCPVMGEPINKDISIDYRGGKLYFCCKECISKFKADSAKYAARANLQLVATGQAVQSACPVTGKKVDSKHTLKVCGIDIGFCCGACPRKVAKAGAEEQLKMISGDGFEKGFTVKKN